MSGSTYSTLFLLQSLFCNDAGGHQRASRFIASGKVVHYCVTRVFFRWRRGHRSESFAKAKKLGALREPKSNKTLRKHADIWPCGERRALIKLAPSARQVLSLSRPASQPTNNNRRAAGSQSPRGSKTFDALQLYMKKLSSLTREFEGHESKRKESTCFHSQRVSAGKHLYLLNVIAQ